MTQGFSIAAIEKTATYLSAQTLAALTDLSPPTVRLRCVGVPTRAGKGKTVEYDARAALKMLMTNPREDIEHHRTRNEKFKADILEIELAKLREDTFSREQIEKAWVSAVYSIRAKLLALPGAAASEVVSLREEEEVERVLLAKVDEVLSELERCGVDTMRAHYAAQQEELDRLEEAQGPSGDKKDEKESKGKKKAPRVP